MKVVVVLVLIFGAISSEKPTEKSVEGWGSFGYEILEFKLALIEEVIANVTERLLESVKNNESKLDNVMAQLGRLSENHKQTADKISALEENNSRILERVEQLETAGALNRKSMDNQINEIKMSLSAVSDNITENNSRIAVQIEKLESVVTQNHKYLDNQINQMERNLSAVSDNITENNSRILQKITELESTGAQNQQSLNETKSTLAAVSENITFIENLLPIHSCKTFTKSGVYQLEKPVKKVYCEMTALGGGWLVIQQRVDRNLSFKRNWNEYRDGFGVVAKNESFWLGNEAVHQITKGGNYELAIELRFRNGPTKEARYSQFRLAGEDEKYRLTVGGHSGSLRDEFSRNNNMKFSTIDNDNDLWRDGNCASKEGSGWWFDRNYSYCSSSDLNYKGGPYWPGAYDYRNGFGHFSRMMIRRK